MSHTNRISTMAKQQQGVALFTALVFLIVITLLSLTAMRATTLELKMATNEQSFARALESAQSAIDSLFLLDNFNVNAAGFVTCYNRPNDASCNINNTLATTNTFGPDTNKLRIVQGDVSTFACRVCETSSISFDGVTYRIESAYDNTAAGGARADIAQGFMRLIAKQQ